MRKIIGKYIRESTRKDTKKLNGKIGSDKIKISTLSPENITNENRLRDIISTLKRKKTPIACIQETNDSQDKNKYIAEYTIIKSPAEKITGQDNENKYAKAGVAII